MPKSALMQKLQKNTTLTESSTLDKSKFFNDKDLIPTSIPALNVALSGQLDGGVVPGVTMFAGPSKHFKTLYALLLVKAYLEKYPEAVLLFYDSEFGTPKNYWKSMGIDEDRVFHCPLVDIEQLKVDIMNQVAEIDRGDKIIIAIDSIGNLASKKEVTDALDGKSVADMTRAKALKSLFRMVTPHLNLKDIPMVVVNHTYKEIGLYPKDIVGGGTGSYYSSDNIFIVGRSQEKKDKDVLGYHFTMNVEKSRYVKEKSKIPVYVSFDGGIDRNSALLDWAIESGIITKEGHSYVVGGKKMKELTDEVYQGLLQDETFQQWVKDKFQLRDIDV